MYASTPGKLLRSRYRVLSPLGKGGFGQTFIAEDLDLPNHPRCVVKQLKPASSDRYFLENARRLFQSEAQSLMRLGTHDQIPRLLAYFEEDQEFYLVQELIEGHPLSEELPPGKRWAESEVCELLYEVLHILQFIHAEGVIHRDLKPDNLIRRRSDRKPVLVDFGTVKEIRTPGLTRHSRTSSVATIAVGTPGYMPTEQGRGKPRPNSDIYALGVMGIQAVTGLNPDQFQEDPETGELIWRPWAQVSDRLAEILTQMVRYYFRDRYQTAEQVLVDLAPLLGKSLPIVDHEPVPTLVVAPVEFQHPPAIETWVSAPVENEIETNGMESALVQEAEVNSTPIEESSQIEASEVISSPVEHEIKTDVIVPLELQESAETLVSSPIEDQPQASDLLEVIEEVELVQPAAIASTKPAVPPIPQISRTILAIAGMGIVGVAIVSLTFLLRQPQPTSSPVVSNPAPQQNQLDPDQETLNAAIELAKDGKINSLEAAIQKTKNIKSSSSVYAKAKAQMFTWQTKVLQNYLQSEAPNKYEKVKDLLPPAKPQIKQIDDSKIVISYDGNVNEKFNDENTALQGFALVFMELLKGNSDEKIDTKYSDFKQLTIYPEPGTIQATLSASDWDAYTKGAIDFDGILKKIQISNR